MPECREKPLESQESFTSLPPQTREHHRPLSVAEFFSISLFMSFPLFMFHDPPHAERMFLSFRCQFFDDVVTFLSSKQCHVWLVINDIPHQFPSYWNVGRIADEEEWLREIPDRFQSTPLSEFYVIDASKLFCIQPCNIESIFRYIRRDDGQIWSCEGKSDRNASASRADVNNCR